MSVGDWDEGTLERFVQDRIIGGSDFSARVSGRFSAVEARVLAGLGTWQPLWMPLPGRSINATGTTLAIPAQGDWAPANTSNAVIPQQFAFTVSDWAIPGLTLQWRVRGVAITNATAPAADVTYALRPITGAGGAANQISYTTGSVVTSVTLTPVASSAIVGIGSAITAPADGLYTVSYQMSTAQAANSWIVHNVWLERRWV